MRLGSQQSIVTKPDSIYVAGHCGMVGSAVVRALRARGCERLLLRTHQELDLGEAAAVRSFFEQEKPEVVIVAAARVGGIHANATFPATFLHDNLAIAHHLIHEAYRSGVKRLLFLGSSCIYPRETAQPMREEQLLSGPLESTNEAYAIAKIAGIKLAQYYRQQYGVLFHSVIPCNLYGPGDYYHLEQAHVLPALLRRFHEARQANVAAVTLWGKGTSRRELLHVDDLAKALLLLLEQDAPPDWINVGSGSDITIRELAELVARLVGFEGKILWDTLRPDGTPQKLMNSGRMRALGWQPSIDLALGVRQVYGDFLTSLQQGSLRA